MARTATIAQKHFAQGLALGKPATVAYQLAHPNSKPAKNTLQTKAHKAKKSKLVQAELARLLAEPMLQPIVLAAFAEAYDSRRLREHAVGVMVRLTTHSDPLVQMHAANWIYDYARQLDEERKSKAPKETKESILANLRGIYAKSLPRPEMIVEASKPPVEAAAVPAAADPEPEETGWMPADDDPGEALD